MKNLILVVMSVVLLTGCSRPANNTQANEEDTQELSPTVYNECTSFFDNVKYGDFVFTINDEFDVYYSEEDCGIRVGSAIPGTGKPVVVDCEQFQGGETVRVSIAGLTLNYTLSDVVSNPTASDFNGVLSKSDNYLCINTETSSYIYKLSN